jgi:outer membrane protein TolC
MLMLGVVNLPTSFNFTEDGMTMKMLGLSQTIPYAGQKSLQSKASRAEAEAARAERAGVEVDLAVAAKLAFLDLYYNELLLKEMTTKRQVMEEIAASVAAGVKSDQTGRADAAAAQADVWRMDADILSMQQEVDAARNSLSALMGRPLDQTLPPAAMPPLPPLPETVDGWLEAARQNYPPLRKLRYQSEMYAFSSASAKRMRWPTLKLSANYGFRADTPMEDRMNMLGFQAEFSLPIFSGRRQGDMALSMSAMKQSADADAIQMWREVEADLKTMHNKIRRLSESLSLYHDRIIPADEDAYNSAFAGYSANRQIFADLLMRAVTIYRDRVTAHRLAWELAQSMAEVEKYTTDPQVWTTGPGE